MGPREKGESTPQNRLTANEVSFQKAHSLYNNFDIGAKSHDAPPSTNVDPFKDPSGLHRWGGELHSLAWNLEGRSSEGMCHV